MAVEGFGVKGLLTMVHMSDSQLPFSSEIDSFFSVWSCFCLLVGFHSMSYFPLCPGHTSPGLFLAFLSISKTFPHTASIHSNTIFGICDKAGRQRASFSLFLVSLEHLKPLTRCSSQRFK